MMVLRSAKGDSQEGEVQVLATLPGEDIEDACLVEATVAEINETWRKGGLETARKIGELVTKRFFAGNTANAHSRKGNHKSFQALVTHQSLRMAASNLWYCVAVFEHFGVLPVDVAEALTVGHHRVLSHVKNVVQRIELAQLSVAAHLTVGQLRAAIADNKVVDPNARKRGRPALVPVVKQLNQAKKALVGLQQWDASRIAALGEHDRAHAMGEAREFAFAVAIWIASLEEVSAAQA